MTSNPTETDMTAEERLEAARGWLRDIDRTHWGNCPAHPDRVRDTGPCDPAKCGVEVEMVAALAALEAAARAQVEAERDALARAPAMEEALRAINEQARDIVAALLAVKGRLIEPYEDDPRWSPWTRFVEPASRKAWDIGEQARAALSDPEPAPPPMSASLHGLEGYAQGVYGEPAPECEHEWVSAVNEAVVSGEMCTKCRSIRPTTKDG